MSDLILLAILGTVAYVVSPWAAVGLYLTLLVLVGCLTER